MKGGALDTWLNAFRAEVPSDFPNWLGSRGVGTRHDKAIYIGCAGWTIPAAHRERFPEKGTHLARYEKRFNGVEINSSFYRPHLAKTYARWGAEAPPGFRFSVKAPRAITHDSRLEKSDEELDSFLDEVGHLEEHLGPLLFQLPPSLNFDEETALPFFEGLRSRFPGEIVLEPRHGSWLAGDVLDWLKKLKIAVAATDPPLGHGEIEPRGWTGLMYYRLHGAPRMYYSTYSEEVLAGLASRFRTQAERGATVWCIFDNTAAGAAQANALRMREWLGIIEYRNHAAR